MSFKNHDIRQGTLVNQDLFNSMARNDDIIKEYYSSSSHGILAWSELESGGFISAYDPDSVIDGEDPEWQTFTSFSIDPQDERVVKFSVKGLTVIHQGTSGITEQYNHALNARFTIQYPDDLGTVPSTTAVVPYRFVASGNFIPPNTEKEFGRIFGHNICISTLNYKSPSTSIYKNFPVIKPGQSFVNFQIRKLNVPQNITGSSESKIQIMVEDIGEWR
jgi:hypothetical protein